MYYPWLPGRYSSRDPHLFLRNGNRWRGHSLVVFLSSSWHIASPVQPTSRHVHAHASATLESPCEVALREYLKSASRIACVASSVRVTSRSPSLAFPGVISESIVTSGRVSYLVPSPTPSVACEVNHAGERCLPASSSSSRSAGL